MPERQAGDVPYCPLRDTLVSHSGSYAASPNVSSGPGAWDTTALDGASPEAARDSRTWRTPATAFGTKSAAPGQIETVTAILSEHLALGDFACFVVEEAGEVLSYGIGMIHQRLPQITIPQGAGATSSRWRPVLYTVTTVMATQSFVRFRRGIESKECQGSLVATALGEPLYRSAGFDEERFGTAMIWIDARGQSL